MSLHGPSPAAIEADQAHAQPPGSLASAVVAWTAIIFVCPVALLALYALVPNIVDLLGRVLRSSLSPRSPLTIMLLAQVALILCQR
jgi:hypothetical protein